MNLYSKKLTGLKALHHEKLRLQAEADAAINTFFTDGKHYRKKKEGESFNISDIYSLGVDLLTSKGTYRKLLALAMPILDLAEIKLEKKFITSAGKEVLGGYIKWKAIEVGMSALSALMERTFPKKEDAD